jgi:predicted esterase
MELPMHRLLFAALIALLLPSSAYAQGTLAILMPGAMGAVPNDFLVRNEARIRGKGVRTVITTSAAEAASLSRQEAARGTRVILVGMSKGTVDVAEALVAGAQARRVVLVSGSYRRAMARLGSPANLPPALLIHHPNDTCRVTLPESAREFVAWSGGKARVTWVNTSGREPANACGPLGAHGFYRQDGAAVSAINAFIRS